MRNLVAFLDILGTSELVKKNRFSDLVALDFVGPVGIAAYYNPKMRFAAFSDSVIISAGINESEKFVLVIAFLYAQWFADYIFVRGGIAEGDMRWIDHPPVDEIFDNINNFMYARVYGKALIEAYKLERSSGPGAICYLSEQVACRMKKMNSNFVLDGPTAGFVWTDKREANMLQKCLSDDVKREPTYTERRKHVVATKYFYDQVNAQGKYLSKGFSQSFLIE